MAKLKLGSDEWVAHWGVHVERETTWVEDAFEDVFNIAIPTPQKAPVKVGRWARLFTSPKMI